MHNRTLFSFIYNICRPYWKWYIFLCLAPIFSGVYAAINNYIIKIIIDTITGDIRDYYVFLKPLLIFIIIELLLRFFWSLHDYSEYKMQGGVFRDVVIKPYEYLQNHSYSYFQNNFSGSLVSKIKGLSDGLYGFWDNISHRLLENFSVIIVNVIMIAILSKELLLPVVLYISTTGTICYYRSKVYDKYAFQIKSNYHQILGKLSDKIINIFTIFSFATKAKEVNEIKDFYRTVQTPTLNKLNYFNYITWLFIGLLDTLMIIGIFIYAAYLRKMNIINTGTLAFTILIVLRSCHEIFSLINNTLSFIQNLADFRASLQGIFIKQEIIDKPNATDIKISKGDITFKNLSFSYDKNTVFEDLNLKISAGQKIGIVGNSGAGKSTLISLLLKNFRATDGDIIIDGQSIYDISSNSLRSQISLIPQDIMLFHRTISENIGYAKESATQEEIEEAAKTANIHNFIMTLPEKYNTLVGERGIKLSGGQRQRIAIARAILKNAPILILDEATAALDTQTEQEIQRSIDAIFELKNITIIAIAHRLSTIKHMDRIIVMEKGQIIEDGSFNQLIIKENGKFKELWENVVNV